MANSNSSLSYGSGPAPVPGWRRLVSLLSDPVKASRLSLVVGVLLVLPSLGNGLALDDFFHRDMLLPGAGHLGRAVHPLDVFAFFPHQDIERLREMGLLSWWASAELHLSFLRPLAAFTHWLDHRLWPDAPWLMHLHSVAWYAATVASVALLFRELGRETKPPWLPGVALLLFAIDDRHGLPAGWIASRNIMMATTFGALSIYAQLRRQNRLAAWISPPLLLLSLASAEFGIGAFAYLLADAVVDNRGWRRLSQIAPHAIVIVGWQLGYTALGYGTAGAGLYTHPVSEPLAFLAAVVERGPVLLASQLTLPFAEIWGSVPEIYTLIYAAAATCVVALVGYALRGPIRCERATRVMAMGALLSVIPCASTYPNERLLYFTGIGGAWLVARAIYLLDEAATNHRRRRTLSRLFLSAVLLRHVAASTVGLPLRALMPGLGAALQAHCMASLPDDVALSEQTLVVLNVPHEFLSAPVLVHRRLSDGGYTPQRVRTLGATGEAVRIHRADDRTLELSPAAPYLSRRVDALAWSPADPRGVGYWVDLGDVRIDVTAATLDHRPTRVRARFSSSLEDARWRIVAWQVDGYREVTLPAVGATLELPAADALATIRAVFAGRTSLAGWREARGGVVAPHFPRAVGEQDGAVTLAPDL